MDTSCNCVVGVRENSQIVLSNGLVNQAKRLDRAIRAFAKVLAKLPNTYFVILGREHPTEPLAGKPELPCTVIIVRKFEIPDFIKRPVHVKNRPKERGPLK